MLVAQYARTLSGIEQARARRGGSRGELADKKDEELVEMVVEDATLREAMLRAMGKAR